MSAVAALRQVQGKEGSVGRGRVSSVNGVHGRCPQGLPGATPAGARWAGRPPCCATGRSEGQSDDPEQHPRDHGHERAGEQQRDDEREQADGRARSAASVAQPAEHGVSVAQRRLALQRGRTHPGPVRGAASVPVVGPVPLLTLALLAVVAGAAARGARSRAQRRAGVRRGSTVLLLVLALLGAGATAADAVNTGFGYLPRVGDVLELPAGGGPWPEVTAAALTDPRAAVRYPDGGVLALPVAAGGTGLRDAPALVWLPPQYFTSPTERFPVVYLFHGAPGVPADWLRGGDLARTALALARTGHPAVVVLPRTSRGWLDDPECVDGAHEQVETCLWQQLVPTVDGALRTIATRDGRAPWRACRPVASARWTWA